MLRVRPALLVRRVHKAVYSTCSLVLPPVPPGQWWLLPQPQDLAPVPRGPLQVVAGSSVGSTLVTSHYQRP